MLWFIAFYASDVSVVLNVCRLGVQRTNKYGMPDSLLTRLELIGLYWSTPTPSMMTTKQTRERCPMRCSSIPLKNSPLCLRIVLTCIARHMSTDTHCLVSLISLHTDCFDDNYILIRLHSGLASINATFITFLLLTKVRVNDLTSLDWEVWTSSYLHQSSSQPH